MIERSADWAKSMSELMGTLDTSMSLTFSLDWKPREAQGETELDTAELVRLLNKDRKLLTAGDSLRVAEHFRAAVKRLREKSKTDGETLNYAGLIRRALDYRGWYAFRLFYQRKGEAKKELTDRVFNRFSGGEKAMAMYAPLFASTGRRGKSAATVSFGYLYHGERSRLLALASRLEFGKVAKFYAGIGIRPTLSAKFKRLYPSGTHQRRINLSGYLAADMEISAKLGKLKYEYTKDIYSESNSPDTVISIVTRFISVILFAFLWIPNLRLL